MNIQNAQRRLSPAFTTARSSRLQPLSGRHERIKKRNNQSGKHPLLPACGASCSSEQVQLLQPCTARLCGPLDASKILVYFPGTDGTGNAIAPQLPGLFEAGFDVRSLFIDMSDRSNWEELTTQAVKLIKELLVVHPTESKVTLLAESFGGCLALRCAAFAPELFERMVLVNPATSFTGSYGGLLNAVASTNLLSVFPEQVYQVAQAVLLPFLVDKDNVREAGLDAVRQMIIMSPPENRRVAEPAASHCPTEESRQSVLEQFESYAPAAAGSWRLRLLCTGNLSDEILGSIRVPTLLVSSAKDRLLRSLQEGARLERVMQNAMRVVLPKSGHTALLEEDVKLIDILRWANFLPPEMLAASAGAAGSTDGVTLAGDSLAKRIRRGGNGATETGPLIDRAGKPPKVQPVGQNLTFCAQVAVLPPKTS